MMRPPTDATTSIADRVIRALDHMLSELPPTRSDHCIYRVPDSLRRVKPECYAPRLVAIGPLHRDNARLKPMEELKLRLFNNFMAKIGRENDKIELSRNIVNFILTEEQAIRRHYQEEIALDIDNFSLMMVLDSVFIVGLLLQEKERDPMFENRWLFNDLVHDILLIENQIPLFVTNSVYSYLRPSEVDHFHDLVQSFFKDVKYEYNIIQGFEFDSPLRHFVEYLWVSQIPILSLWSHIAKPRPRLPIKKPDALTASRLLEYGVKFKPHFTSLMGIEFIDGILYIPKVKVNEFTETLFRNLVAFEHCENLTPRLMSDYIIFMDSIIDTPKDVNILTGAGIIQDDLQDPEKVSELLNNLYKETITEDRDFFFAQQSRELIDYRRDKWHRWKARWYKWKFILKRDIFNSPWSIISFIGAVILLGLTLVQTICSIYQGKGVKM